MDSPADDNVSKHTFDFYANEIERFELSMNTKSFSMRVFDLDVMCFVGSYDYAFWYELAWADCKNVPLLYKSEVVIQNAEGVIWTDKKDTAEGGHVWSSVISPKGAMTEKKWSAFISVELSFEFSSEGRVRERFASSLLEDKTLTDVVVVCGERTFDCHKAILTGRSKYFRKMFSGSFKEAVEGKVFIESFDPDVIKLVIDFLYSDEIDEGAVSWQLFEAAKMYLLPGLENLCLRSLRKNLDENSCLPMLEHTFKHELKEPFEYALKFFEDAKSFVIASDSWKAMAEKNKLLAEIIQRM